MSDSEDISEEEQHEITNEQNDEERAHLYENCVHQHGQGSIMNHNLQMNRLNARLCITECQKNGLDTIRSQLSTLSFEELQKLKEKLGAKVYREALFGNKKNETAPKVFKRENKNRPREMSSKRPVHMLQPTKVKKKEIRDPRFDPLCGEFDKKQFNENYSFLSGIRINDIKAVKKRMKEATDPEEETKLRRLLQRLNDQHKASKKSKKEKEMAEKKKQEIEQQFKEGKQPLFKSKSERRVEALVKQYEDLKKEGTSRVQRHLKRRQQKIKKRSFKAPTGVS